MESTKEPSDVLSGACSNIAPSMSSGKPSSDGRTSTYQDEPSNQSSQGESTQSGEQPPGEAGGIDSVVKDYNDMKAPPTVNFEHGSFSFDAGTWTAWTLSWLGDKDRETRKFQLYIYFNTEPGAYKITPDDVGSELNQIVSSDHIAQIKAAMDWVNRTLEA